MKFLFEDFFYDKVFSKARISGSNNKIQFIRVLIPFTICWLPLAIMTLMYGTFWTGDISTSFITNFDTQVRFLIAMPILFISEKLVSSKLGLILMQFVNSGVIIKEEKQKFDEIINKQTSFLNSKWTNLSILIICYIQVFVILLYESTHTSFLSWQLVQVGGESSLNFVGKWCTVISRPFVLFYIYVWLLRIIIWGNTLRKISNLDLKLYPEHPDMSGGIGYLGYFLRYFSPITFAFSAVIAGNMADFIIIEGFSKTDLRLPALGYFVFITLLFTLPMLTFSSKMINSRETSMFENYNFANGLYRELRLKIDKKFDKVTEVDLDSAVYSSISDYNAVVDNVIKMKYFPFTLKDLVPLWVFSALPFVAVILIEIPFIKIFENVMSVLI